MLLLMGYGAIKDCEVGMLIGYNCPTAIAPTNSILGKDGELFAVKTILGWSIIASATRHTARDRFGILHHISVREQPAVNLEIY